MMRQAIIPGLLAIAFAGGAGCGGGTPSVRTAAGSPDEATVVEARRGRVPAGTTMWVSLDEDLSLKSRPGSEFTGRVTAPVLGSDGEILVPERAQVVGHVVRARRGGDGESPHVILRIDSLAMAGRTQSVEASIIDTKVKKDIVPEWEHVAIGGGAGAILGGLIKGGGGALVGGVLGAVAGTAISLGTQDGELESGSKLAIRLERPIRSLASLGGGRRYY